MHAPLGRHRAGGTSDGAPGADIGDMVTAAADSVRPAPEGGSGAA